MHVIKSEISKKSQTPQASLKSELIKALNFMIEDEETYCRELARDKHWTKYAACEKRVKNLVRIKEYAKGIL